MSRILTLSTAAALALIAYSTANAASPQSASRQAEAPTSSVRPAAKAEFMSLLERARSAYEKTEDYTAQLRLQERIDGQLGVPSKGIFKFRKPFAVYLKWTEGINKGLECLYVRGRYENNLIARPPGLLGIKTYRLDPKGSLAMKGNRHPITEAGLGHMIEVVENNRLRAEADGRATIRRLPDPPQGHPPGARFELLVEGDDPAGYYCRRAVVTFDPKTGLISAVQAYDWRDSLFEDYRFFDLRTNTGLTDRDFDPDNPKYDL